MCYQLEGNKWELFSRKLEHTKRVRTPSKKAIRGAAAAVVLQDGGPFCNGEQQENRRLEMEDDLDGDDVIPDELVIARSSMPPDRDVDDGWSDEDDADFVGPPSPGAPVPSSFRDGSGEERGDDGGVAPMSEEAMGGGEADVGVLGSSGERNLWLGPRPRIPTSLTDDRIVFDLAKLVIRENMSQRVLAEVIRIVNNVSSSKSSALKYKSCYILFM